MEFTIQPDQPGAHGKTTAHALISPSGEITPVTSVVGLVYGPHCQHDECGWFTCDHTGLVDFPCQHQVTCPYCGPDSEQWPHVAQGMTEWLVECYGTVEVDRLRTLHEQHGIPDSAIRYAELLQARA